MQLKKFLIEIERLKPTEDELKKAGLPLSEQARWEIDVVDDEFNAYSGPMHQLVYCLDTIQLFQGLEQLSNLDSDAPDGFTIWGVNTYYNFHYAYNYLNGEIVLLDDTLDSEPNMFCAASGTKFLDCLLTVAEFYKLQIIDAGIAEAEKEEWIKKATKAAGGIKYEQHCKVLIG